MPAKRYTAEDLIPQIVNNGSRIGVNSKSGDVVFSQELKDEYCRLLSLLGQFSSSARKINISTQTISAHRKKYPEFEQQIQDAIALYRDHIDDIMYERGVIGIEEPLVHNGRLTGDYVMKRSDAVLIQLAKRRVKEYKDGNTTSNEQTVNMPLLIQAPFATIEDMQAQARVVASHIKREEAIYLPEDIDKP